MILTTILFAALKHELNPKELYAILSVESNLCTNIHGPVNKNGTYDHGCGQINDIAIKHYKLNKNKLKNDIEYSIMSTAKILLDLKSRFPKTYLCRYNIGTAKLNKQRLEKCNKYLNKVKKQMEEANGVFYIHNFSSI